MTAEEKQNEINSLSKKMRDLEDEIKQDILNEYKHLIGVCFNASNATYMKIASIEDVDEEDIRIKGSGISLREDVLSIRFEIYSYVTEKFIKDNEISRARFSILFDLAVERIREEYDI